MDNNHFRHLVESMNRIDEGKPQKAAPGAQVKGKRKAKPVGPNGEHPFSGELVGEELEEGEYGFLSKFVAEDELEEDLVTAMKRDMNDYMKSAKEVAEEEAQPAKKFNRGISGHAKGIQNKPGVKTIMSKEDPLMDSEQVEEAPKALKSGKQNRELEEEQLDELHMGPPLDKDVVPRTGRKGSESNVHSRVIHLLGNHYNTTMKSGWIAHLWSNFDSWANTVLTGEERHKWRKSKIPVPTSLQRTLDIMADLTKQGRQNPNMKADWTEIMPIMGHEMQKYYNEFMGIKGGDEYSVKGPERKIPDRRSKPEDHGGRRNPVEAVEEASSNRPHRPNKKTMPRTVKINIELDPDDKGWVRWGIVDPNGGFKESGNDYIKDFMQVLNNIWAQEESVEEQVEEVKESSPARYTVLGDNDSKWIKLGESHTLNVAKTLARKNLSKYTEVDVYDNETKDVVYKDTRD